MYPISGFAMRFWLVSRGIIVIIMILILILMMSEPLIWLGFEYPFQSEFHRLRWSLLSLFSRSHTLNWFIPQDKQRKRKNNSSSASLSISIIFGHLLKLITINDKWGLIYTSEWANEQTVAFVIDSLLLLSAYKLDLETRTRTRTRTTTKTLFYR